MTDRQYAVKVDVDTYDRITALQRSLDSEIELNKKQVVSCAINRIYRGVNDDETH